MADKIRSVKEASYRLLISRSLIFATINFIIASFFLMAIAYMIMGNSEVNFANILSETLYKKEQRIVNISNDISLLSSGNLINNEKLTDLLSKEEDIIGGMILDNDGKVIYASGNNLNYLGYNFSGRGYLNHSSETYFSDAFVDYESRQVTMDAITPIINNGKEIGKVVLTVSPQIIENNNLKDMDFFITTRKGDIIFSNNSNVVTLSDNILDSRLMQSIKNNEYRPIVYKDKISNKYAIALAKLDTMKCMYIVVQHDIFSNKVLLNGLMLLFIVASILVLIFVIVFSAKITQIFTTYLGVFKSKLKKIEEGEYVFETNEKYLYTEINEIVNSFSIMAGKVHNREQELQVMNEELITANNDIKQMLVKINSNEQEKKGQYIQIMWTLLNLIELKDEYTAGHSRAVTHYSELISQKLIDSYGLNLDMDKIQVAAMLHDIGKISIDEQILNKPTKLTKEEYEIIKTHAIKGYYALKDIESLKEERKMIKYHHERYDGLGYPEGIKGDLIPLGARIICVADCFDAMTSDRPYRKGMPIEKAINELIKNKGSQFDPLLVDVFVSIMQENKYDINNVDETAN